ncbi:MAG: hypothetical protein ABF614_01370 [Bifidobacterium psychraerophilum]
MLRSFIYLDTDLLSQLMDPIDTGSIKTSSVEKSQESNKAGGANLKVLKGDISKTDSQTITQQIDSSAPAQFDRFIKYCESHVDDTDWLTVEDASSFSSIRRGQVIEVQADVEIPDFIKVLDQSENISSILDTMSLMKGFLPNYNESEMSKVSSQMESIKPAQRFVQEKLVIEASLLDDLNARVVGKLNKRFIINNDDLEGDGYSIVGKVRETWGSKEWKQVLTLPGMDFMNREQRRKLLKQEPNDDEKQNFIQGPAALLQILAIYY